MNDSDGNRTRVTAVKGRCLNRLTTEPYFKQFTRDESYNSIYFYSLQAFFEKNLEKSVDIFESLWYYCKALERETTKQSFSNECIRTLKIKQRQSKEPDKIL